MAHTQSQLLFQLLTEVERQVLAGVVNGGTNKSIAEELGYSESTVKHHIRSIMKKLYAHNRAHAAALAVQLGLAEPTEQVNEEHYGTPPSPALSREKDVKPRGEVQLGREVPGWEELTVREKRICFLLASDEASEKSTRELARELKITRSTFHTHRRKIFQKLQVNNRYDLAHLVHDAGGSFYTVITK